MTAPIGVLFVCHANICRSPLAEGVLRELAHQRGVTERLRIDSAGTWAMDGQAPHPLSLAVAREHGFELTSVSRSVEPGDLRSFDHILAMDRRNLADLERYRGLTTTGGASASLRLFRTLHEPDAQGAGLDVPDPVAGGPEHYAAVHTLLDLGCRALLNELFG